MNLFSQKNIKILLIPENWLWPSGYFPQKFTFVNLFDQVPSLGPPGIAWVCYHMALCSLLSKRTTTPNKAITTSKQVSPFLLNHDSNTNGWPLVPVFSWRWKLTTKNSHLFYWIYTIIFYFNNYLINPFLFYQVLSTF